MKNEMYRKEDMQTRVRIVMNSLVVNALINQYTIENVVMGYIAPKEKIPFDTYIGDLSLQDYNPHLYRGEDLEGFALDCNETVCDKNIELFLRDFFFGKIEDLLIMQNVKDNVLKNLAEDKIATQYFDDLFLLFKQILAVKVTYNFFDVIPKITAREVRANFYRAVTAFLFAICTKKLPVGYCVDRYVQSLPYIPYFTKRLLTCNNGHYYLAVNNPYSPDFRLALLNVIRFLKEENAAILELKTQKWLTLAKSDVSLLPASLEKIPEPSHIFHARGVQ